jgi:anti-sigma B factor antagonist
MQFDHSTKNDILIIKPDFDRLGSKEVPKFKEHVIQLINESKKHDVVFDLNQLHFIDSSGVSSFLSLLRLLNSRGGELKLAGVTPPIRTVLELVSMHKIFEIFKTTDDAVDSFR